MKLPRLLKILSILVFVLLVLGGTVRNLGAGLSCPDWPLCYGKIIPPFDVRIYAEYVHRLVAGLVSIFTLICAYLIYSKPAPRKSLGGLMAFALALLFAQVILGGLTVLQLLKSAIVTLHLATGTLFFATLVVMTLRAQREERSAAASAQTSTSRRGKVQRTDLKPGGLKFWATTALIVLFTQMILGALVSSHNAGLACPDFPTCLGTWWPGFAGIVGFHFTHRLGATVTTLVILFFAAQLYRAKSGLDTGFKRKAAEILALLTVQVLLGISNVVFHLPVAVSVAHLAVAEALFALILISRYEIDHFKLHQPH